MTIVPSVNGTPSKSYAATKAPTTPSSGGGPADRATSTNGTINVTLIPELSAVSRPNTTIASVNFGRKDAMR